MKNKLPKEAYGGVHGKDYVPFVTDKSKKGVNVAVMIIGVVLAAVFAASTAYSGMKSGLTVAAGIPGAIIGSMLIGAFARNKGILGKNITQGMASGGESIASGLIYVYHQSYSQNNKKIPRDYLVSRSVTRQVPSA